MNPVAVIKIKMIKNSLRCFIFGLLALLPLIGFFFAAAAFIVSEYVRAGQRQFWNPARTYWIIGLVCASLGTIFWCIIGALICFGIYNNGLSYGSDGDSYWTRACILAVAVILLAAVFTVLFLWLWRIKVRPF